MTCAASRRDVGGLAWTGARVDAAPGHRQALDTRDLGSCAARETQVRPNECVVEGLSFHAIVRSSSD